MEQMKFEDIISYLRNGVYDDNINSKLLAITNEIKDNFKSDASLEYLLQLIVNAYITEKYTLDLLNRGIYWNIISTELLKVGYRGAPASVYLFNNIPNNHEVYSADLTKDFYSNSDYYDIIGDDRNRENRDSYKIEVKATISDKITGVTNFHNADIVFIYELDTKRLYFKYKEIFDTYSDIIYLDTLQDLDTVQIGLADNYMFKLQGE